MSLAQAYEILKKIQNKTASKEEKALRLEAFNIISHGAGKALRPIL